MTDRQSTHAPGCWSWGPKHYECAVRKIKALRAEVDVLKAENARLRDALEEIRNRSSIGVMRSDQSELEIVLADICLFVDAVLWKEDKND